MDFWFWLAQIFVFIVTLLYVGGHGRQTNDCITVIFHLPLSIRLCCPGWIACLCSSTFSSSSYSLHLVPGAWCKGNALNVVGFVFIHRWPGSVASSAQYRRQVFGFFFFSFSFLMVMFWEVWLTLHTFSLY